MHRKGGQRLESTTNQSWQWLDRKRRSYPGILGRADRLSAGPVTPVHTDELFGLLLPYGQIGMVYRIVYHLRWKFSKTRWFSNISIRLTLKFSRLSVNQIVAKLAIQRFFIILTFKMPSSNYLPILKSIANGLFQWKSHDETSIRSRHLYEP